MVQNRFYYDNSCIFWKVPKYAFIELSPYRFHFLLILTQEYFKGWNKLNWDFLHQNKHFPMFEFPLKMYSTFYQKVCYWTTFCYYIVTVYTRCSNWKNSERNGYSMHWKLHFRNAFWHHQHGVKYVCQLSMLQLFFQNFSNITPCDKAKTWQ